MFSLRIGTTLLAAGVLVGSATASAHATTEGFGVTIAEQPANSVLAALDQMVSFLFSFRHKIVLPFIS